MIVAAQFGLSTPSVFKQLDVGRAAGEYPASAELVQPVELLKTLNSYDGSEAALASPWHRYCVTTCRHPHFRAPRSWNRP